MQIVVLRIAYGWLVLSGLLHFTIDVISQYLRGVRPSSPETTLYYGLNSTFSLGQVSFGLLALTMCWRRPALAQQPVIKAITILAGIGWILVAVGFMEYWEPVATTGTFLAAILIAYALPD